MLCLGSPPASQAAASIELYGTFHAMGVIIRIDTGDDTDQNAVASVSYRTGSNAFAAGLPLVRIDATRFVGSLFWLEPGTAYDVTVAFSDPGDVLHGGVVNGTASTRAEVIIPAPTASHVASPAGSGTTCSLAAPCSLATALNQANAGEEVVLRGGTYFAGGLSVPRSGSPGAPIVIRAYPAEKPILDGSDPQDFTWAAQGGGVYHTTVSVADPHLVAVDGERLYPYQSLSDLQSLVWAAPGFYASGTDVYVRLAGDVDPNPLQLSVSRFNLGLEISQDHIYVVGLGFRYYGQGDYAKGIYLDTASDNLIRGCTFTTCDLGIGIKRESHRNVIEDNVFSDTIFDWPWDAVKDGSGLETGGVRMYDPMPGRGTVIRRNTFYDDFDGFGVCPESDTGTTCETDVYENVAYDLGDDGFETDGYCSNVRIWDNTFHDVLIGVSLAPVYVGPVYAIRNLIYNTGVGNNSYTGSCFKFNSGYGTSGPMFLYHNTCDAALAGNDALDIRSPGTWTGLTARNNIWSATEYAIENDNTDQPLDLDHDALYTTWPNELAWWSGHGHLRTLADLIAATGQETNGMHANPMFAAGGYELDPASALVDAALYIAGVNDGFTGLGPDIGAFELAGAAFEAESLALDHEGNSILEPGEVASVVPTWHNLSGASSTLTGSLTEFRGPGEPDTSYDIVDGAADYGTVATGATTSCATATGDCYAVLVAIPTSRPAAHWDSTVRESLSSGVVRDWTIHVGETFDDVPSTSPFYPFIETLLHHSVTAGCTPTGYCPKSATTRAQMAVFVLRAKEGAGYSPPACGSVATFSDVPATNPFCPWIEELVRRGVVSGCGDGRYCPDNSVTREQMAVFVLKTLEPGLSPPACVAPVFGDVPASSGFCPWVEELFRRNVVVGCAAGSYCPSSSVTREQMGVFIGKGFDLTLYGP